MRTASQTFVNEESAEEFVDWKGEQIEAGE